MRILITDVTEMGNATYCVAGWCLDNNCMIRPLPNGRNWSAAELNLYGVQSGAIIEMNALNIAHNGEYPHSTEDTRITLEGIRRLEAPPFLWDSREPPFVGDSLQEIFNNTIEYNSIFNGRWQGVHIARGTNVPSLGGLWLPKSNLEFCIHFDKFKVVLYDGRNQYLLPVSNASLKEAFRNNGLIGVKEALPNGRHVHVRVGLARPFAAQPNKCYVMLNGVHG